MPRHAKNPQNSQLPLQIVYCNLLSDKVALPRDARVDLRRLLAEQ